jgi:hypothetical protein
MPLTRDAKHCRDKAVECGRLAERAPSADTQAGYLDLQQHWIEFAEAVEAAQPT